MTGISLPFAILSGRQNTFPPNGKNLPLERTGDFGGIICQTVQ